jgi:hypothetical protein
MATDGYPAPPGRPRHTLYPLAIQRLRYRALVRRVQNTAFFKIFLGFYFINTNI